MAENLQDQKKSQNPLDELKNKVSDVSAEKRWAMSCYIPIFNILTCALTSVRMMNNKFCRFHARQGFVLFGLWFITILVALVSQTLSLMFWGIALLLHIAGLVIVYTKKETKIPVIGQIAMMIPEYYVFTLLTGKIPDEAQEQIK